LAWALGPLSHVLERKWILLLFVILLVALAIETTILIVIFFDSSLGGQNFPRFSLNPPIAANCATLTNRLVSSNAGNRTVLFDCSTSTSQVPAFRVFAPLTPMFVHESGKADLAEPVFTLPAGYLHLAITSDSDTGLTCTSVTPTNLTSGRTVIIGQYTNAYDYCAIISDSVNPITGFSILWVEGTPPPPAPYLSAAATPSNITISPGQNATSSITVISHYGFKGTLTVSTHVTPWNATNPPTSSVDQSSILLPSDGIVVVTLRIATTTSTLKGRYLAWINVMGSDVIGVLVNVT
jgi:hypothetical protein